MNISYYLSIFPSREALGKREYTEYLPTAGWTVHTVDGDPIDKQLPPDDREIIQYFNTKATETEIYNQVSNKYTAAHNAKKISQQCGYNSKITKFKEGMKSQELSALLTPCRLKMTRA